MNNAGITRDGLLVRMTDEHWDAVLDTNLTGAFHTIRRATPEDDARPLRPHRQRLVGRRPDRPGRARPTTPPPRPASSGLTRSVARELGAARHHLQRGRTRAYRDRDDRRAAGRVADAGRGARCRSGASAPRRSARPSSRSCAPTPPATSPARSCPSTAASAWATDRREPGRCAPVPTARQLVAPDRRNPMERAEALSAHPRRRRRGAERRARRGHRGRPLQGRPRRRQPRPRRARDGPRGALRHRGARGRPRGRHAPSARPSTSCSPRSAPKA